MPITIDEKFDSREATESESPTTELLYVVQGTDDDLQVKALVAATSPATYAGLVRDSYTIKTLGGGVWESEVGIPLGDGIGTPIGGMDYYIESADNLTNQSTSATSRKDYTSCGG